MGRPGTPQLIVFLSLSVSLLLSGKPATIAQVSPILHYTLTVDSSDLSGYDVTIHIANAPPRFHLAMATHHEYDDRYWRFVTGFHAAPPATFSRQDSALWSITTPDRDVAISYRIKLPPPAPLHFSHRPFLKPYGGLVGDIHSFMYFVEDIHAPCRLSLHLPAGWQVATGADSSNTTAIALLDAPILIGHLRQWTFSVDGTVHKIGYLPWSATSAINVDSLLLNIHKIVTATENIFNNFPYLHYTFLLEDSSAGALEHGTSVTLGATPADLSAPKTSGIYGQILHEFFHSWNGMSMVPVGFTPLNYGPQQLTTGLWFSEGVTMYYADLIARLTGLPAEDSTRLSHLTHLITRYYSDTGNCVLPPSRVSLADYTQPGPLGDYSASTHLQGELLATCMDILIREKTHGQYSLDDMMRKVFRHFGGQHPFLDTDLETEFANACGCDEAHTFFRDYIYEGKPIDFGASLALFGLRFQHDQTEARDREGHPLPDIRVYSYVLRDDTSLRIGITNPKGCWATAGLHTGDIITAINDRPIHSRQDFQSVLRTLHVRDTAVVIAKKETGTKLVPVYITGYTIPSITITEEPFAPYQRQRLFHEWAVPGLGPFTN
jgi:predicted metalloprotease with PDZ domain